MKQIYIPVKLKKNTPLTIDDDRYHYLKNVLRIKSGDTLRFRDAAGNLHYMELSDDIDRKLVFKPVQYESGREEEEPCRLHLYQCLPKSRKMDLIIRQCAEAGVSSIHPLFSRYTVPDPDSRKLQNKLQRWQKIAREAVQQSGAVKIPGIAEPVELDGVIAEKSPALRLLFHQDRINTEPLSACFREDNQEIELFIGPEGGFSGTEVQDMLEAGFQPVFLGNTVLRVETAALFAIASVKTILEEKLWRQNQKE